MRADVEDVPQTGKAAVEPCVFIGGCQRSGTTLVQRLLCQAPATNPLIGEAKYLRNLLVAYRQARRAFDVETRFYFRDVEQLRGFHSEIVERLLAQVRALHPGARRLVLKEPHLTLYFPELAELLPPAKFVVVVRDPRDAVASMVEVGGRLAANGADDRFTRMFGRRDMAELGGHFLSFYQPVLPTPAVLPSERLLFLRYEDLVGEPVKVLSELGRFTGLDLRGIDPTAAQNSEALQARRASPYKRAWLTDLDGGPVSAERVGVCRKVLAEPEIRALTSICGKFMERFGYISNR